MSIGHSLGVALLAVAAPALHSMAQFDAFKLSDPDKPHATCTLIADVARLVPGSTATLGLAFTIEPKWHIYWNGRNDSGTEPKAEWTLPDGIAVQPMLWPAPKRHVLPGDILDHIYEGNVILLVPVTISPTLKPGSTVTIRAKVDWLVCHEMCVPEDAEVSITLPVGQPGEAPTSSPDETRIRATREALPIPLSKSNPEATVSITPGGDSGFSATISATGATSLAFYPLTDSIRIQDPVESTLKKGSVLTFKVNPPNEDERSLKGVLAVTRPKEASVGSTVAHYWIDVPVGTTSAPSNDREKTKKSW